MKRTALVFDLDGTLVDSLPDIAACLNASLAELGAAPLPEREVRGLIGDGSPRLVERGLAAAGLPQQRAADRLARFLALYEAAPVARSRAYPGVPETLAALAATGWRLGVCTNKPQAVTEGVLAGLGIAGHFAVIIGGDALPFRKPDPRHLAAVLERLGATPSAAVMIGDNEHDVAMGRALGTATILMRYGYARVPLDEIPADRQLDDFAGLPQALRGLAAARSA
jgi:phosphoglycolate phosphatase